MGFKQAAILAPVSFFLGEGSTLHAARNLTKPRQIGVLFICFNVDHRVLWSEVSEDVIKDGFQFYTTFFNAPPAIKVRLQVFFPFREPDRIIC